jgi:hypothetical protein
MRSVYDGSLRGDAILMGAKRKRPYSSSSIGTALWTAIEAVKAEEVVSSSAECGVR